MIQPIVPAINWFLGLFNCLPFSVRAFIGLAGALFILTAIVNTIRK